MAGVTVSCAVAGGGETCGGTELDEVLTESGFAGTGGTKFCESGSETTGIPPVFTDALGSGGVPPLGASGNGGSAGVELLAASGA